MLDMSMGDGDRQSITIEGLQLLVGSSGLEMAQQMKVMGVATREV